MRDLPKNVLKKMVVGWYGGIAYAPTQEDLQNMQLAVDALRKAGYAVAHLEGLKRVADGIATCTENAASRGDLCDKSYMRGMHRALLAMITALEGKNHEEQK